LAVTASWRDGVPQDVQDDLDRLFGIVEPFALRTIARFRRLVPFGAALENSGESRLVGSIPERRSPLALAIRGILVDGLRKDRDSLKAVILVEDVAVDTLGSDAIRFTLEHRDGPAIAVFAPYSVGRWPWRRVTFGEGVTDEGERLVWAKD
jgi:hypothetical protein